MANPLSVVYFPAALLLGALHALEPGHAKVLTASYLIGIKGTKRDSVILGLSVALTHSLVVVLISVLGLWIGNEAFTGRATEWLERGSGLVAIAIGSWMLWRRTSKRFRAGAHAHHPAPEPVVVKIGNLRGNLEIINTPLGERFRFVAESEPMDEEFTVEITRSDRTERLNLERSPENRQIYLSGAAPEEPHEFHAQFVRKAIGGEENIFVFSMKEPDGHDHHGHEHLDDIAHAKEHAADLPDYAKRGERPTIGQIIAFGAAGGMIPCPASITVMLLALAAGKTSLGLFTVMGFSLGLAITLVGIGVIVVSGLSRIQESGRFTWVTKNAPVISAALVICSGLFALLLVHKV